MEIIDLTSVREDTGPARLLHMVVGRYKQGFKSPRAARPARKTLSTAIDPLREKQRGRPASLFAEGKHSAVAVTLAAYEGLLTACRPESRASGRQCRWG